jgi:uncharacterized protein (DUF2384 family)
MKRCDVCKRPLPEMPPEMEARARQEARDRGVSDSEMTRIVCDPCWRLHHARVAVGIRGIELFGGEPAFRHWLETPNMALGGVRPALLLADGVFEPEKGKQTLLDLLGRMEHGVYS